MIYLDTSLALAHILGEDLHPSDELWEQSLVSSRLLEYEIWTRIHARALSASHAEVVRSALARVALLELAPPVLVRAVEPFPVAVRTLDALHLASAEFLHQQGQEIEVASYDQRMLGAARAMGLKLSRFSSEGG